MPYSLPPGDIARLRKLARTQAAIAGLDIMQRRKAMWTGVNDAIPGTRPPFAIETWTFDRDFMPPSIYECQSPYGRQIEAQLLRNIRHHELLDDDQVCPDTYDMYWHVWIDEFGIEIPTSYATDSEGVITGYHFECPIKDLSQGFDMIKPATFGVDREGTQAELEFLQDLFDGILPVARRSGVYGPLSLTQRLVRLMPQDAFFEAMYECPEQLHQLMRYLTDNALRICRWAEAEGLLELNNGNQCTCGTCFNFTTLLPKQPVQPGQVKLKDMWAPMDSQETVGVSPRQFHTFCFPYYAELADLFGLVYWGCCEPVDPIWEQSISRLPNLKAVSISRWADQHRMADYLDGTGIVYSRKPNPNLLSVDKQLNEEAWAAEIRSTLDALAGKEIPLEFVVRDVYTLHGDIGNARRAVDVARSVIDTYYPPL